LTFTWHEDVSRRRRLVEEAAANPYTWFNGHVEELRDALKSGHKKELAPTEMSALALAYALGYRGEKGRRHLPERRP
jgi:hypothetical protein